MKTNKLSIIILISSSLLLACGGGQETTEEPVAEEKVESVSIKRNINTKLSSINWEGEMMGLYAHSGTLDFNSGEIELADGRLVAGNFEANLSSMNPTDENFDEAKEQTPEKLVNHLSSADFFDVENFPVATFTITSSTDNTAKGMMTIRGVSDEEVVENITMISNEDGTVSLTGTMVFNRKKYDVAFDHPIQEMVISNDVSLSIEVTTEN